MIAILEFARLVELFLSLPRVRFVSLQHKKLSFPRGCHCIDRGFFIRPRVSSTFIRNKAGNIVSQYERRRAW